jgi:DNA ligase-1
VAAAQPFARVVEVSAAVAADPKRSGKVKLLAELIAEIPIGQLRTTVTVLSGSLPASPLGLGPARLRAIWMDEAAQTSLRIPGPPLTILDVERTLREVARSEGPGSVDLKVELLRELIERATSGEKEFLLHLCFGELRQGALDGVMLDAIAKAFAVTPEAARRAHMLTGDLGHTAWLAAVEGEPGLASVALRVFRPLSPMLASPADTVADALARHGTTILEWKLDGARIQVHRQASEVRVFTRTLRDVTAALPDVVAPVAALAAESIVLDGEAIALRPDGRPHTFQTTMSRFGASRADDADPPLTPFFFDVLHLNGETLIDRPQRERNAILRSLIAPANLLPALETASADEAEGFLQHARSCGHEGVVAKDPTAPYEAGRRGKAWMKVKAARTLDLVVLAVERGSGRRSAWWSNIHLGARGEGGELVMLGKTFKGMTDETLRWQTATFPSLATRVEGHVMYLEPAIVAEIAFNEIQRSPRYPAGLALRFARLERYRPDKTPAEADTIETVREIFTAQTGEDAP